MVSTQKILEDKVTEEVPTLSVDIFDELQKIFPNLNDKNELFRSLTRNSTLIDDMLKDHSIVNLIETFSSFRDAVASNQRNLVTISPIVLAIIVKFPECLAILKNNANQNFES